jgi:gliding motility-associated-like protein
MKKQILALLAAFCYVSMPLIASSSSILTSSVEIVYLAPEYAAQSNYLVEGCQEGQIHISRGNGPAGALHFQLACSGTSTDQVDFDGIMTSMTMAAGQDELVIPISALTDDLVEGEESLIVSITSTELTEMNWSTTLELRDANPLAVTYTPVEIYCDESALLQLDITGGSGAHTVEWANQSTGNPFLIENPNPGNMAFTITDLCPSMEIATGAVLISFIPYPPIVVEAGPPMTVNCTEDVAVTVSPSGGNGEYSYQWYVNGNPMASNTDESFLWTGPVTSVVSVVVTDACNSAGVDEFQITLFNPPPMIEVGSNDEGNCLENIQRTAVVTGGLGPSDVNWYYNGIWVSEGNTISLPIGEGGVLSAQAEDGCGSIGLDELTITELEVPVQLTMAPIFGLCGESVDANATVTGGVNSTYAYSWTMDGNVVSTDATASILAWPNTAVQLTVTDVCGNAIQAEEIVALDIQTISVNAVDELLASNCSQMWASGTPVITGGTGNYVYSWHMQDQNEIISNSNNCSLDVTGAHNQYLIIEVTDECTNVGSDSILIQLTMPGLSLEMNTEYSFGCLESFAIAPQSSGGTGPYTYAWTMNDVLVNSSAIWNGEATNSGEVVCVMTDVCGLSQSVSTNIIVQPTGLEATIISDDETLCPNQEVQLMLDMANVVGDLNILWSNGQTQEVIAMAVATNQEVYCTITDVCGNSVEPRMDLQLIPSTGDFSVLDDFMLCHGYESGPLALGGYAPYSYSFNSGSIELSDNGIRSIGTSEVLITVTDACGQTGRVTVDSRSCDFIVPNVFTPNNDAKNDTFEINGLEKFTQSSLVVFNRDGLKVFESSDYHNDWTAEGLPSGTYFYVLHRNDGETFESSVAILR